MIHTPKKPEWATIIFYYDEHDNDRRVSEIYFKLEEIIIARFSMTKQDFSYVYSNASVHQLRDIIDFIVEYNDRNALYNFADDRLAYVEPFTIDALLKLWGIYGRYKREAKQAIVTMIEAKVLVKK